LDKDQGIAEDTTHTMLSLRSASMALKVLGGQLAPLSVYRSLEDGTTGNVPGVSVCVGFLLPSVLSSSFLLIYLVTFLLDFSGHKLHLALRCFFDRLKYIW
jgi:hypothetical protein